MEPNPHGGALPACYGRDYLILLVQDPFNLFAYWEVTAERLTLAASYLGEDEKKLTLAIRLLERLGHGVREIARSVIAEKCGRCYFEHLNPGTTYQAEVGVLTGEGFFPLICSEATSLPGGQEGPLPPADAARPAFPAAFFARS